MHAYKYNFITGGHICTLEDLVSNSVAICDCASKNVHIKGILKFYELQLGITLKMLYIGLCY